MSLLTLIQDAADRLGIVRPGTVIGSADQQVRQLLGLAQQEGKELARRHPWQAITFEDTFTATATETQTGVLNSDFDRFVNGTFFNRTQNRRVEGPMNVQAWQNYKASVTTVLFDAFRLRGSSLLLAPTPSAGDSYAFEYVSKFWCTTAAGTTATLAAWTADDNVTVLDEELMVLGVVWRFLKAKGLDYSEPFRTYELQVAAAMARDGGKPLSISFAGPAPVKGPPRPTWPDGNWNLS
jgi:hypothetical protein